MLTFEEILALPKVANEYATHYMKDGLIVASVYKKITNLRFNAHLGNDDHIIRFTFDHSGPVAIIYHTPIKPGKELPLETTASTIAIMSVVCYADVSLFDELSPRIITTQVGQYDQGVHEMYELAKKLICHFTQSEWCEDGVKEKYNMLIGDYIAELKLLTTTKVKPENF